MKGNRRRHDTGFKARMALEAIKGVKTIQDMAKEFEIHPVQVREWKKSMAQNSIDLVETFWLEPLFRSLVSMPNTSSLVLSQRPPGILESFHKCSSAVGGRVSALHVETKDKTRTVDRGS